MPISKEKLAEALPDVKKKEIDAFYEDLVEVMDFYDINTPKRMAAFLAQCAHESGNFRTVKENLNYKAETLTRLWPKLFPAGVAKAYASMPNKQEAIANRAYGSRMGNGSEESGDGFKFCGRGLIQLTGRNNYQAFADSLEMNIDDVPEYLATFEGAAQSACWFWEENNLNQWADKGDILTLTKKINGGTIGLEDRIKQYEHAIIVLGE
jgi:putative chitinase